MAWNIGATSETGLWVGGENIITRDLTFFVDPGNIKSYNNGASTSTVTDLAQGEAMTKSGAGWGEYDGGVGWTFDGTNDHITSDSNVTVSNHVTGNSTTAGTFTVCLWMRTGTNYVGTSGGDGPMYYLGGYTISLFFQSGDIVLYAADDDGGSAEECEDASPTTDLEGDDWYFICGQMNNSTSTNGDQSAGTSSLYHGKCDSDGQVELLTAVGTDSIGAGFEFRDTNVPLELGQLSGNSWFFNGELGPVWTYDRCLTEDERVLNYNAFRNRYYTTAIG